jgi:hypothetical protein
MMLLELLRDGTIHPLIFINVTLGLVLFISALYFDIQKYKKFRFASLLLLIPVLNIFYLVYVLLTRGRKNSQA